MSAPTAVLDELRDLGVQLRVDGDRLRFRPVDRVPPELLEKLREHKPAILAHLRPHPCDDPIVQACRQEAERLGALGRSPSDADREYAWITGDLLTTLPQPLQNLVAVREGWTPESWVVYLWDRAIRCDRQHQDTAELCRKAARLLEFGKEDHGI